MSVFYTPLFQTLAQKKIKLTKLNTEVGIASSTLAKLKKNEAVSLSIIGRIAEYLECGVEDVVSFCKINRINKLPQKEITITIDHPPQLDCTYTVAINTPAGEKILKA